MVPDAWVVSHTTPIVSLRGAPNDGKCRLTMPGVNIWGANSVMCFPRSLRSWCLDAANTILPEWIMFLINPLTKWKFRRSFWHQRTIEIPVKWCQWLAWKVLCHQSAFPTHGITWRWAYVAWISLLLWQIWCHFPSKSTQSCCNGQYIWT